MSTWESQISHFPSRQMSHAQREPEVSRFTKQKLIQNAPFDTGIRSTSHFTVNEEHSNITRRQIARQRFAVNKNLLPSKIMLFIQILQHERC